MEETNIALVIGAQRKTSHVTKPRTPPPFQLSHGAESLLAMMEFPQLTVGIGKEGISRVSSRTSSQEGGENVS